MTPIPSIHSRSDEFVAATVQAGKRKIFPSKKFAGSEKARSAGFVMRVGSAAFVICHWSFVIGHSSLVLANDQSHSSLVIGHSGHWRTTNDK
jgi:hypothetical protein